MFTCVLGFCVACTVVLLLKPFGEHWHCQGQLHGDEEHPFSGVTSSGRVWKTVPESDRVLMYMTLHLARTWLSPSAEVLKLLRQPSLLKCLQKGTFQQWIFVFSQVTCILKNTDVCITHIFIQVLASWTFQQWILFSQVTCIFKNTGVCITHIFIQVLASLTFQQWILFSQVTCIFKNTGVCITHIFIQVLASLKMPFCAGKFFHNAFLLLPPKTTVFQCDTGLGSFAVGILMSILFQLATYHFLFNFLYIFFFFPF